MNNYLIESMHSFKEVTLKLIEVLKRESYDTLEILLNDRESIIENLKQENYDIDEFKRICIELKLVEIENVLVRLMNTRKQQAKSEMDKIKTVQKANNNYQKSYNADSLFFNKKI
jgi:hypothetical protein